jgi:nucleotide-binding universal stress UspA family protein
MIEYPKKVLLATDGTEDSAMASRAAVALVASSGAELHVVHVGEAATSNVGATAMRPALPGEPPGYAERQARKLLDRQVEEIQAEGGTVTETHLKMGRPAAAVVALAAETGADLLVVGSGGPCQMRRAVAATTRRAAIGRAADAIVRTAPCPVLVVRGGGAEAKELPNELPNTVEEGR